VKMFSFYSDASKGKYDGSGIKSVRMKITTVQNCRPACSI